MFNKHMLTVAALVTALGGAQIFAAAAAPAAPAPAPAAPVAPAVSAAKQAFDAKVTTFNTAANDAARNAAAVAFTAETNMTDAAKAFFAGLKAHVDKVAAGGYADQTTLDAEAAKYTQQAVAAQLATAFVEPAPAPAAPSWGEWVKGKYSKPGDFVLGKLADRGWVVTTAIVAAIAAGVYKYSDVLGLDKFFGGQAEEDQEEAA